MVEGIEVRASQSLPVPAEDLATLVVREVVSRSGVDPELIDVIHGDTELVPEGVGSWSSRSVRRE